MELGFLGLGQMGAAIAERLEAADVRLDVFDPDPVAMAPFVLRGAESGVDPDLMVNVINVSTGRNSATLDKVPQAVLPGTFDYGAKLATMVKDIGLGLKEAEAPNVPMWVHETVGQLWRFGVTQGLEEADITALIRVIEGWADVEVRSRH